MYEYKCVIVRVIDGDTVDVDIDLGFDVWLKDQRIRINGIDAPESRTSDPVEKIFGLAAKAKVEELLSPVMVLRTIIDRDGSDAKGKFGRILGDFILGNGRSIGEILVEEGYAARYYGQSRADIEIAHLANRNLLMESGKVDPKTVQAAQK